MDRSISSACKQRFLQPSSAQCSSHTKDPKRSPKKSQTIIRVSENRGGNAISGDAGYCFDGFSKDGDTVGRASIIRAIQGWINPGWIGGDWIDWLMRRVDSWDVIGGNCFSFTDEKIEQIQSSGCHWSVGPSRLGEEEESHRSEIAAFTWFR